MSYTNNEQTPRFTLVKVDYNPRTRYCKITFNEATQYRTIERYVTQNYVRHPVYSPWKTKTKLIERSVKLTNAALENLNKHEDELVARFAYSIISQIGQPDLHPSWYQAQEAQEKYKRNAAARKKYLDDKQAELRRAQLRLTNKRTDVVARVRAYDDRKSKLTALCESHELALKKAENRKPSILLNIVTFGIYYYLRSESYKDNLRAKILSIRNECASIDKRIERANAELDPLMDDVEKLESDCRIAESVVRDRNAEDAKKMESALRRVSPLQTTIETDERFIPLKQFVGAEYSKIVGCYVIKNNENGKCYVGQSKDVVKRIRQHFKGTEPHNIIFAEDYYSSSYTDKSTLFDIMVTACERGDLDRLEAELIEKFDAYTQGYNSTSGNK